MMFVVQMNETAFLPKDMFVLFLIALCFILRLEPKTMNRGKGRKNAGSEADHVESASGIEFVYFFFSSPLRYYPDFSFMKI